MTHGHSSQLERKDERRIATMLTLSGLPPGKTLEDFDWSFQPKADRRQLEALATCSFVREKQHVTYRLEPRMRTPRHVAGRVCSDATGTLGAAMK